MAKLTRQDLGRVFAEGLFTDREIRDCLAEQFTHVHFTHAISGYWLTNALGGKVFSSSGSELTGEGRRLAHSFPCNCDKKLEPLHLVS